MKNDKFFLKYGPWALVTGGASGIGAEFCGQLAARGINILIVDVQKKKMESFARELSGKHGIKVKTVVADLASPGFLGKVSSAAKGLEINLLVNNAGYGSVGDFMETDPGEMERTISVNCRAPMLLCRKFAGPMIKRKNGGIIFIASTAAYTATPRVANYSATKAYNLVLGESLWYELKKHGVDAMSFAPGATNTPAFHTVNSRIENVPGMPYMETGPTVSDALDALGKGPSAIAGRANRFFTFIMTRFISRKRAALLVGKNTLLLYPDESN
ncbi:MAG: SDR family NAD(P)-dependent oxidoreductase [Spirochaetes bacterium]|nr:SDR family NAD(P)-dependent oxidoreductase [Spirochaetota bacterium]